MFSDFIILFFCLGLLWFCGIFSDQFALVPRRWAADYFSAIDSFYECVPPPPLLPPSESSPGNSPGTPFPPFAGAAASAGGSGGEGSDSTQATQGREPTPEDRGASVEWFPPGVGATDMLLAKHLLGRRVPVMLAEVHAPLARYYDTHLPVRLAEIHVPGTHTKSTSLFSGFATTGPSVSL